MFKFQNIKNTIIYLFLSIGLSYTFIYKIPWHSIRVFQDFERYKYNVRNLFFNGYEEESFGVFILFSEVLWARILQVIPYYFYDIDSGLAFISFCCLTIYIFFTITRVNFAIMYILLFNPIFIDLIISQVRIGLAFCLLLLAYSTRKTVIVPIFLIICATLIHTATPFLLLIFFVLMFLKYFSKNNPNFLKIAFILPLFIMISFQFILLPIFDYFGDVERAGYMTNPIYSSLFFSFPWIFFSLMLTILPKGEFFDKNIDIISYAICMGSLFFFASVFKFYGSRFVAVSFPLFIISINSLSNQFKYLMFSILFLYQIIYFAYWI